MSQQNKLRETIDRMVEDAIRRILPGVMNEVLLRTIASANIVQEDRRPTPTPQRVKAQSQRPAPARKPQRRGKIDLSELLDESAGSEYYQQAVSFEQEPEEYDEPEQQGPPASLQERVARNIQNLPPGLREMAEGMELDEDEMVSEEHTSIAPRGDDAGDLGVASRRVGVDFGRMAQLAKMTEQKAASKKPKMSAADAAAQQQFEEARLKRMRERLNGGKPVGEG